MREVVIDVETTGLKASDGHRIIELGMVELVNGELTGEVYMQRFNPGVPISPEATEVNGITNEMLVGQPTFAQCITEIENFLFKPSPETVHFIGHSVRFDIEFLENEFKFAGKYLPITQNDLVCTRILGKMLNPETPAKLHQLCEQHNVDISDLILHEALDDAIACARLYQSLCKTIKARNGRYSDAT